MFTWKLIPNYEESPAAENMLSLYFEIEFHQKKMPDIIDIDELFSIVSEDGYIPVFTCSCGSFGCGGYYIRIFKKDKGLVLKNSYRPVENPAERDIISTFQYEISWKELYALLREVYEKCREVRNAFPACGMCSGAYGKDISKQMNQYELVLEEVEKKYRL